MDEQQTPYEQLGGEEGLKRLVDRFYEIMDSDPAAKETRDLHTTRLHGANRKLLMFLSGWLGGPNLYIEQFGHPRLRRRHMPFKIGNREAEQWMYCMKKALADVGVEAGLAQHLEKALTNTAQHMRNVVEMDEA